MVSKKFQCNCKASSLVQSRDEIISFMIKSVRISGLVVYVLKVFSSIVTSQVNHLANTVPFF